MMRRIQMPSQENASQKFAAQQPLQSPAEKSEAIKKYMARKNAAYNQFKPQRAEPQIERKTHDIR
jgi:hypothetical protein